MPREPRQRTATEASDAQRRAASQKGAAKVVEAFSEVLTRKQFAEQVGIHATTLRRWESLGVVRPELQDVIGIPTRIFAPADVEFGRRLVQRLRDNAGRESLHQAAAALRQQ